MKTNAGDKEYHINTNKFDEIAKAETLETNEDISKLRKTLDQQLTSFQDLITKQSKLEKDLSSQESGNIHASKDTYKSFKVKKLQANSEVNNEEAVYLNLWQRKIEMTGDKIISNNKNYLNGKVQIMATIDVYGNLVNSEILISSGIRLIDDMAINILKESSPFAPFNINMSNEYSVLEIVRDWNFSSN